ncbi:GAF domain-containing protein [Chitinimonas sp. PSY-7]|uniref:GAF domain-containing protein n=1 Tax=Chitinimonas sp. PSY-7 TaxID=3459088 RepID=UPI00403FE7F6
MGFSEAYLEPLNIYSMLCAAIELDGSPLGLVCCENSAQVKVWSQQDLQYLQQGAAMVGLAMKKFGG